MDALDTSIPAGKTSESVSKKETASESDSQAASDRITSSTQPAGVQSRDTLSSSQSPTLGASPIAFVSKDEDVSATPNASSESTWDKVSQASHNDDKVGPKSEGDEDDSKLSSWEHVPPPVQLKDAPPPSVNIWQKRAQDAQSKVKDPKQTSLSNSSSSRESTSVSSGKTIDSATDMGKWDSRRKAKPAMQADDKANFQGSKEASKSHEGRPRGPEDGMSFIVSSPIQHQ